MRITLAMILALVIVGSATSADLDTSNRMPAKAPSTVNPNIPNPDRQGGDTIDDAVLISALPYSTTGTTTGYTNDYDEACPYTTSTAPDVVYEIRIPSDAILTIDMLGSAYDTKIYVYDEDLELVACNDDFYPDYVSKLEDVPVAAGAGYYLIIDGYEESHGDYELTIVEYVPCVLEFPSGAMDEGEPSLVNDYVDYFNGGCNTEGIYPFQDLYGDENGERTFWGTSGWYLYEGSNNRDTDWIILHAGDTGVIEVTGDAERETYLFDLGLQDCAIPATTQVIIVGPCSEDSMTMETYPGYSMWFCAGPTTFTAPGESYPYEYNYTIHFTGLAPQPVATQSTTWTTVKSLFR